MNAKKIKAIRRAVRLSGKHPREVVTKPTTPFKVWAGLIPGAGPSATFLGQRELAPGCGRHMVKAAKKAVSKGLLVKASA